MANSSTQNNVTQASGHSHTSTNTALKYRTTNSSQPLAHADVDDNFEILRKAINGVISDIDTVVKTDVPTGAVFTDTTYVAVTDSVSGLMTGAMKQKLDDIAENAEVNVQTDWNATTGDALILNKPNIAYTSAISVATTAADGLMSLADKTKLDGIQSGATAGGGGASVTTDPTAPSNPSDGDLWFNENEAELYVYTASLGAWIQTNGGGGGGGEIYSSGWVSADSAGTAVANGATLNFDHSLGATDLFLQVYMAKDASGLDAVVADAFFTNFGNTAPGLNYGAQVSHSTNAQIKVQLGGNGWRVLTSTDQGGYSGYSETGAWGTTYTHIKVVVASSGGGGSNPAGIPRTQWPYQAVEGLNWLNSLALKGEKGELWKYSPLTRFQTGFPEAWVFSCLRGLNGYQGHAVELYRDGDLVKMYGAISNECHGVTGVSLSDTSAYNKGGYIIAQTNKTGCLGVVTSKSEADGYGVDGNAMGVITPVVTSDVILDSANIGASWVTVSTGKANSLVYLMIEPIQGQTAAAIKVKQKGDAQIESVSRSNTWGGGGAGSLTVDGSNNATGVAYWRGGYVFCMTDSNGDLEVNATGSEGAKITMIGYKSADLTKADVEIHNAVVEEATDDLFAVEKPTEGTTISTGLSGYNLVFIKTIGTDNNNIYYRTPGDTVKPYLAVNYSGWGGCNGGCLNTNLGTYAVAMTDANGNLKAFSSHVATVKSIIKGSVPITLA